MQDKDSCRIAKSFSLVFCKHVCLFLFLILFWPNPEFLISVSDMQYKLVLDESSEYE